MGLREMQIEFFLKLEGKGLLGRPRRRWMNSVKIDVGEVQWGHVD
jgi:hypothetical protein